MISPAVGHIVQLLDQSLQGAIRETWQSWLARYLPALDQLLQAFRIQAARPIDLRLDCVFPDFLGQHMQDRAVTLAHG
jgi:hypothetical protein